MACNQAGLRLKQERLKAKAIQKHGESIPMTYPNILGNPIWSLLDKSPQDFTREDFLRLIEEKSIERVVFHHIALDGKLKEIKLPLRDRTYAERILAAGERVDGSSLFPGLVERGQSDLYIVPIYRSAFFNPFDPYSLDFLCRYLTSKGEPAPFTPDNILCNSHRHFQNKTGLALHALGELEFFLVGDPGPKLYSTGIENAYHSTTPFMKTIPILDEILAGLSHMTGAVKYAHGEVGVIPEIESDSFEIAGARAEQMEVEFLPAPIEDAADFLILARWLIRNIAYRHHRVATFAPKLTEGIAGNGMHVHMKLMHKGENVMTDEGGNLSEPALRLIGGLCRFAPSLTAFGNTRAASYLRLVPDQEAPTHVFWSDCDRKALVRVPLGWRESHDLASRMNPQQSQGFLHQEKQQTIELRTPDGSALIHLLFSGIVLAAEWGLTNDESLLISEQRYWGENSQPNEIHLDDIPALPGNCAESLRNLQIERACYENDGGFPAQVINHVMRLLSAEDDSGLKDHLNSLPHEERRNKMHEIMHRDLHWQ